MDPDALALPFDLPLNWAVFKTVDRIKGFLLVAGNGGISVRYTSRHRTRNPHEIGLMEESRELHSLKKYQPLQPSTFALSSAHNSVTLWRR